MDDEDTTLELPLFDDLRNLLRKLSWNESVDLSSFFFVNLVGFTMRFIGSDVVIELLLAGFKLTHSFCSPIWDG